MNSIGKVLMVLVLMVKIGKSVLWFTWFTCMVLCSSSPPPSCLWYCRSFAKPPKQVQVVCECILVIRGYKEISWKTAKGMISEANFLRSLMEMDCDSITASQVKTVKGKPPYVFIVLMLLCDPKASRRFLVFNVNPPMKIVIIYCITFSLPYNQPT